MSSGADTAPLRRRPPTLLLLRLAVVAAAVPVLTRAPLPRLQQWLEPPRPGPVRKQADARAPDRVIAEYGRWVDALIRRGGPVVRRGCLTRGVTLYYGLRRSGVDAALCFGVGTVGGVTEGHCWIVVDECPVLEAVDPYSVFTETVRLSRNGVTH